MNIEAFNNEHDIGSPLNLEGFESQIPCDNLNEKGCDAHTIECAWDKNNHTCVDKQSTVDTGAGGSTGQGGDMEFCTKVSKCNAANTGVADSITSSSTGTDHADGFSDYDYENFNGDESTDVVANEPANNSNGQLVNVDLLLRSLVYGCVFYILAHPESLALVKKCCQQVVKKISGDNVLLVQMGLFVVVYYVLSLFI